MSRLWINGLVKITFVHVALYWTALVNKTVCKFTEIFRRSTEGHPKISEENPKMFWTGAATKAKQGWLAKMVFICDCRAANQGDDYATVAGGMHGYFKGRWTKYCTVRVSSVELQSVPRHFALLPWKTHSWASYVKSSQKIFWRGSRLAVQKGSPRFVPSLQKMC